MTPEQQQQLNDLQEQVKQLQDMLSVTNMPYELREIIRNEVIKNEDSTQMLTSTYTTSGGQTVTSSRAYAGVLVFKWKGKEYPIPHL